jgi:DNA repair ATPase RecN
LNNEERVEEIAKMLSGDKMSSSALIHAKELLN